MFSHQYNLQQVANIAIQVIELIKQCNITCVTFVGNLGAGKTTLIKEMVLELGIKDVVSSPTYSIINEYGSPSDRIYHMDLYRIKDLEEAINAGVEDTLYSGQLCLVEWPQVAIDILPANRLDVDIKLVDIDKRVININSKLI